jgi:2-oxoisovalerate dehydrogenase E1 component
VEVDGSDVLAIRAAARAAVEQARSGGGPTLIEAKTYRFGGHHEGDPGTSYRTKEEVEEWKARCPIKTLREKLLKDAGVPLESVEQIEREVQQWLEAAVQFARESPEPDPSTVYEHIYS